MDPSSRKRLCISLTCNTPFHFRTASRGILSLCNTLAVQKTTRRLKPRVRALGRATNSDCAMLNALAPLSFLLTTNLSGSIFGDDLGAMQTLAQRRRFLAYPPHVTRS
jgi:hypothetical protein